MPNGETIPGETPAPEWVRATLDEYAADLRRFKRVWARTGEKYFGVASPRARTLDAELFIVSFTRFRSSYDGLSPRLAPLFHDRPEAALTARLN